jgi:hypothetical protein
VVRFRDDAVMTQQWKIDIPAECFVNKDHYLIKGKKYLRVTSTLSVISKPGLLAWFQRVGEYEAKRVLEKRQVLGTKVHKLIELTLKGEKIDLDNYEQEIKEDLLLFKEFRKQAHLKTEALEQKLWSNQYGYAGTSDYIGYYTTPKDFLLRGHEPKFTKSSFVIGDWKSSRDIYPEYWLQLAAYVVAFEELTGIKPDGAFICQLRYGKIRVDEKTYEELMTYFRIYKSVLVLYDWKHKN